MLCCVHMILSPIAITMLYWASLCHSVSHWSQYVVLCSCNAVSHRNSTLSSQIFIHAQGHLSFNVHCTAELFAAILHRQDRRLSLSLPPPHCIRNKLTRPPTLISVSRIRKARILSKLCCSYRMDCCIPSLNGTLALVYSNKINIPLTLKPSPYNFQQELEICMPVACAGVLISPQPDLLPVVFCLMVRIFRLMLVLLYI